MSAPARKPSGFRAQFPVAVAISHSPSGGLLKALWLLVPKTHKWQLLSLHYMVLNLEETDRPGPDAERLIQDFRSEISKLEPEASTMSYVRIKLHL